MPSSAGKPPADSAAAQLDAIAAELYALPPEEFTEARNARAATADRALAASVKALRKPTASAWAVDLLARDGQLPRRSSSPGRCAKLRTTWMPPSSAA